ncbi:hypothetical protein AB6Q56_06205 [Dechloromonas sp. ARDL1]
MGNSVFYRGGTGWVHEISQEFEKSKDNSRSQFARRSNGERLSWST